MADLTFILELFFFANISNIYNALKGCA